MKKLLLILILFTPILYATAETTDSTKSCQALFKYETKDILMTPLPTIAVQFYDVSEGEISAWSWDFGDGETSREQNPIHFYTYPDGAHTGLINPYRFVSLTIFTADSCTSYFSDSIRIIDDQPNPGYYCLADFKFYQEEYDSISRTATLQFTNLSEGDSLSYFWDFGNGETSTEKEPKVSFPITADFYDVCLEVIGKENCSSKICYPVFTEYPIDTIIYPDSTNCYVYFGYSINYDIKTFAPALVLDFHSKAENVVEWKWDFGDGNTSHESDPTHIFNLPLDYDSAGNVPNPYREVCLTVLTESGCVAKWCETIYLYMNDTIYPEPNPECHAWFKYYRPDDIVTIPEVIPYRFVDASEGKVISRLWQFEDGSTSYGEVIDKNFDFLKPTQKVCLTVLTADSCESTWCETVFVSEIPRDSDYIPGSETEYVIRYEGYFPIWMSSCGGQVTATVYYKDSIVNDVHFVWSTGAEGNIVTGLCPTQTYSVKAITPNGFAISGTFVFNSDGTVTEVPINWWISETGDIVYINAHKKDDSYLVHWTLCDGTVIIQDSVPLDLINCGTSESNMVLTDSMGNIVYSESISLKGVSTSGQYTGNKQQLHIFPNPFYNLIHLQYTGKSLEKMKIEIYDISGKRLINQNFYDIQNNQKISLDVHLLNNGVYIYKVTDGNRILKMEKIIK